MTGVQTSAARLAKRIGYFLRLGHKPTLREWPLVCRFLGRRDDGVIHGLWRPASEKRQGTKSRRWAAAVQRTLWGFGRGMRLEEIGAARARQSLWLRERRCVQE